MTRGSHGVAPGAGHYYYEVVILEPPTPRELANSLPPNVRLGKKLRKELEAALEAQATAEASGETILARQQNQSNGNGNGNGNGGGFGAHVRLGWSMRTGDLQAPVGYDKWSYGVRDIHGSKIHCSRREDHWGGEAFGPGDVIGCAISMVGADEAAANGGEGTDPEGATQPTTAKTNSNSNSNSSSSSLSLSLSENHGNTNANANANGNGNTIRFFKNGYPMGEFVITKGKREGGVAFSIPDGVYYPAISLYMGATVKVNFGPHFIHPPRKLPTALSSKYYQNSKAKKSTTSTSGGGGGGPHNPFLPVSSLSKPPLTVQEAASKVTREQKTLFFRRVDQTEPKQQRFLELVETEARVVRDAYAHHRRKHVMDVISERKARNIKWEDLEKDEYYYDYHDSPNGSEEGGNGETKSTKTVAATAMATATASTTTKDAAENA